jgi:Pro-kumamolisin, activation domain/Bacterial Ig-like domain (group 3)
MALPGPTMTALRRARPALCALALAAVMPMLAQAQANAVSPSTVQPRIVSAVDEKNLATLRGNTHPFAIPQFDQGPAPSALPVSRMLLVLRRSPDQDAALAKFMEQQQDSSSANFHQWLTPQQFGQQFGPADADIQTITAWLNSRGFQVAQVSNGRTVIEFSGTAGQVKDAFHTEIHKYTVNGEDHWANSSDPQIPSALAPVVAGIDSLYNFPRRPMHHVVGAYSRSPSTGRLTPTGPLTSFPSGCAASGNTNCDLGIAPADFAKIYNVPNLFASSSQFNGDGVTIAVVGDSDINPQDVAAFRTLFGLPAPNLDVIVSGPDPGLVPVAETEADLDVEWSGAVAPNATIDLVIAEDTESSLGADLAAQYAIDNNLAPVISESFGICELFLGQAGNTFYSQLWQQASAQGITVLVSSGDSSSAVCDSDNPSSFPAPAQFGLQVSGTSSTPYNVAVGGTDFNQLSNIGAFWNLGNTTGARAIGYIPEETWNDTCTNAEIFAFFGTTTAEQTCNNAAQRALSPDGVTVVGGSGGSSACTTSNGQSPSTCSGGYTKPSWQPMINANDTKRDVPDVSLFASNGFNGSFYLICEADLDNATCQPSAPIVLGVGGTSASVQVFAGIMALINQATRARQGNANYVLYPLAARGSNTCTSAASPSPACVFYDIPTGSTIAVACASGGLNCAVATRGDSFGILSANGQPAYNTGTGYDLATGLGSVNAANLISSWSSLEGTLKSTTTTLTSLAPTTLTHGQAVNVGVSVSSTSGGTPTGNVSLIANETGGPQGIQAFVLNSGAASGATDALPGGSYTVFAQYQGDGTFTPSASSTVSVVVNPEASSTSLHLITFSPTTGAVTNSSATSTAFDSAYLLRINVSSSSSVCNQNAPGQSGCPTGTVTVTDNGTPLAGEPFALNALGYAEDQTILLSGGAHTLRAVYSGDLSYQAGNAATDSVTITPGVTTTTVTSSSGTAPLGQSVTFTATASPSLTGLPAPTGTMKFLIDSLAQGSPVAMTNGSAQFTTSSLAIGPHTIQAQYSGDSNYASSSGSVSETVSSPVTATANPTTITIAAPGQSGSTTITVTATNGFSGTATLSPSLCSGLPSESSCSFNPSTLTLAANGSATTSLTVSTTASSAGLRLPMPPAPLQRWNLWELAALACALSLMGFAWRQRNVGFARPFFAGCGAAVVLAVCFGCGGGSGGGGGSTKNPGTPVGASPFSVTITVTNGISFAPASLPNLSVNVQ